MKITKKQIKWLNKVVIGTWILTEDGVDVNGGVYMWKGFGNNWIKYKNIPVKFNKISGHFDCSNNELTSLEGCPSYVGGIECYGNKLTSLEGIGEVKGKIDCHKNKINYKKEKKLRPKVYKKIDSISFLDKLMMEL